MGQELERIQALAQVIAGKLAARAKIGGCMVYGRGTILYDPARESYQSVKGMYRFSQLVEVRRSVSTGAVCVGERAAS